MKFIAHAFVATSVATTVARPLREIFLSRQNNRWLSSFTLVALVGITGCAHNPPPAATSDTASADAIVKQVFADTTRGESDPQCPGWNYPEMSGTTDNWVERGCKACAAKEMGQSPIALIPSTARPVTGKLPHDLSPGAFTVNLVPFEHDRTYAFKVSPPGAPGVKAPTIQAFGQTFHINEFHFHVPAEHAIVGQPVSVMEMHVKTSSTVNGKTSTAVFAMQFALDARPGGPTQMVPVANAMSGQLNQMFSLGTLMSAFQTQPSFFYRGGLTTPPCGSLSVMFFVLQNPVAVDLASLKTITTVLNGLSGGVSNARPLQERSPSLGVLLLTR